MMSKLELGAACDIVVRLLEQHLKVQTREAEAIV